MLAHNRHHRPRQDDEPFDKYVKRMGQEGTWAGHMELQAASAMLAANIRIYQVGGAKCLVGDCGLPGSSSRWFLSRRSSGDSRAFAPASPWSQTGGAAGVDHQAQRRCAIPAHGVSGPFAGQQPASCYPTRRWLGPSFGALAGCSWDPTLTTCPCPLRHGRYRDGLHWDRCALRVRRGESAV